MPELLSPFAPLFPWLREHLRLWIVRFIKAENFCTTTRRSIMLDVEDTADWRLDCCDPATRFAVLSALASHGISLPWALGGIWSSLSDEQGGRIVAEVLRRVGEDPAKPTLPIPLGLLSERRVTSGAGMYPGVVRYGRVSVAGAAPGPCSYGWSGNRKPHNGRNHMLQTWYYDGESGPETGDEGIAASEATALRKGAIFWEQVTP